MTERKQIFGLNLAALVFACYCDGVLSKSPHPRSPTLTVVPPEEVRFSNSSGAVVSCVGDGEPSPDVVWFKANDDSRVMDVPGLRHVGLDGSLTFMPFDGEFFRPDVHLATYRCVASNSAGAIRSGDVRVEAVVHQAYEIRLADEHVLRGNMVVLKCPVPSSVANHVRVTSWERADGLLITPDSLSGRYGFLENGELYLSYSTERDSSGHYWCHTEDTVTKEKKISVNYSRIIVTEPKRKHSPKIVSHSRRIVSAAGKRVAMHCLAQGHPAPVYRWFKKSDVNLSLPSGSGRWSQQEAGVLLFPTATPSDSGHYVCLATNAVGEDRAEVELVVEERLQISVWPKEVRAHFGQDVNFNCSVSGTLRRKIEWTKDAMSVPSSDTRIVYYSSFSVFRLTAVRKRDSGVYQCFAKGTFNSVQASAVFVLGDVAPSLLTVFPEKTTRPGSDLSLSCVASGNPAPEFKWSLDGIWPLSSSRRIAIDSSRDDDDGTVSSRLNVSSATVSDGGLYACEAINDVGTAFHSARLNVFGPLMVRRVDAPLSALAGEPQHVQCPFGGYPYDAIRWRKNGHLLDREKTFLNGTLVIARALKGTDDGLYSCEVFSRVGQSASGEFQLVVRNGPRVSAFRFEDGLQEGMRTAVACIVSAGDKPFTIGWLKDDSVLRDGHAGATIMYQEGGFVSTLTIENLTEEHNGNYTCSATNDVATGSYSSALAVKIPPRWVLKPQDATAVAGASSRIDCRVHGVPQPHVRWKMNSGPSLEDFRTIVSSSRVHILVNGSLNFVGIEPSDAGAYLCEADNGVGPAPLTALINLTVHTAPRFDKNFVTVVTRRGHRTALDCVPRSGERPMVFYWRKNNVVITADASTRYLLDTADDSSSRLVILKAEKTDNTLFACSATNDYGYDTMSVQLTVEDTPDAPQNLDVHEVSSQSVRLTWDAPFDGNSPITNYTVAWRQLDGESHESPATVAGSETSMTIRNLKPTTRYFFRVKCCNRLGDSQFSAEVAVTTQQEPPKTAPVRVKAVPLSTKTVNVTWHFPVASATGRDVEGFYVGYKLRLSAEAYTFIPYSTAAVGDNRMHAIVTGLSRRAEYSVVVQAYNGRGAGPPSMETFVITLEFDPPGEPVMKGHVASTSTIKISWESQSTRESPIEGFVLHHRLDNLFWEESRLSADLREYTLSGLRCGSTYQFYLAAFNSAGRGKEADVATVKTSGNAPVAPEKKHLLSVNSTSATIQLGSWKDRGCPIVSFSIQYKISKGFGDWTVVSDKVDPEQSDITITGLAPGTWYTLFLSATNDAGATDAEYNFPTLTTAGEYPPSPFQVRDVSNDQVFQHLTVTVPLVSFAFVLVLVFTTVCFVVKSRSSAVERSVAGNDPNASEATKSEHYPLSVTYQGGRQEPLYFPSSYPRAYVQEQAEREPSSPQFHSKNSFDCRTYDMPYPVLTSSKYQSIYEPQVVCLPRENTETSFKSCEKPVYAIPDRGRMRCKSVAWFPENNGNSSTESDNEEHHTLSHHIRDEARESETECDRLWKVYHESQYEERSGVSSSEIELS